MGIICMNLSTKSPVGKSHSANPAIVSLFNVLCKQCCTFVDSHASSQGA